MDYMKDPHTALFVGPTGCGKSKRVVKLLENEYFDHFDFIVIICPTLRWNKTYMCRKWFWNDRYVILIEPRGMLYEYIQKMTDFCAGYKTLFLIDDIIADEKLDKKRQPLLELAISGRHRNHTMWLLTQSYTAIPKNLRRQAKMLYVWYPKDRQDLATIHEENDVIESRSEIQMVKERLKDGKYTHLVMRMEHPRTYVIC